MAQKAVDRDDTPKKKRLSLSLKRKAEKVASSPVKRFERSSDQDIESLKAKPMSKNTVRSQTWALNVWKEWIGSTDEKIDFEKLWNENDKGKQCDRLCRFIVEAKQRTGEPYSPKSLLQLLNNLQSYANEQRSDAFNFMDGKDPDFKPLHNVLNNHFKKLHSDGIGAKRKRARVVTGQEEEILWEKGVMGAESPTPLQNAIFFYCGLYFCLRGGIEHRDLKLDQFEVKECQHPDSGEMIKSVTYTEHGSKNRQGLVHQVHLENKVVTQYADSSLGDRCFVKLFEKYVSLLPEDAKAKNLFYCKPKRRVTKCDTSWYFNIAVGHNQLGRKLKDMYLEAGLDETDINNHGLRASGITRLYAEGVPEKLIMERSGHLSVGGVRSYERTTDAQKMNVSRVLTLANSSGTATESARKTQDSTFSVEKVAEKLSVSSSEDDKENKMFTFQNLQGCTLNFNVN